MNSKGMSQTLALIVAASVLMMTALTVIFMVQGGLGDFNQNSGVSACKGAIQSACNVQETPFDAPSVCDEEAQSQIGDINSQGQVVSCS